MRRRDFLKVSGETALGAVLLGACSSAHGAPGTTSTLERPTTSTPVPPSTMPPTTPPDAAAWRALGRSLHGRLVLPSTPGYLVDAESYNPVFDGARPAAIAYCTSAGDVATAVGFARDRKVALSLRSGGHCYGGWSTGPGLVVDVSPMNKVALGGAGGSSEVTVGAGTRLVDLYAALADRGVAVPGGSCPSVGIAGLTLGGGIGVLDRKLGLTCDNLISAEVVLASGEVVTASAAEHSDLFWALRGGGGGSFGVVTSFTFVTHPIGELGLFTLVWPWAVASSVVSSWQSWAPLGPDELWSNCLLLASQQTPSGESAVARVTGVYVGPQAALQGLVDDLVRAVGSAPSTNFVGSAAYLDTMLIEGGCEGDTVGECHLPSVNPAGVLPRAPFAATSSILVDKLPKAGVAQLLSVVDQRESSAVLAGGGVALDASGGAIGKVKPDATAYVHRNALATVQYSANWTDGASGSVVTANRAWLTAARRSMEPYMSGGAYVNYADPDLANFAEAYFGSNLARLKRVKSAYDPANLFRFPQSVPPR